ncbi:hypothetical protein M5U04_15460 [Xenorhabdus sp. XENO-1]|uniref:hypothetical protein n=1 Tax=Xenorhabdus bovienii TaxID=40576 RepID=UPI0020CA4478|nr:hypothetical protein [Xenorhabdus bovienii]MCP9269444.1 hypothetical protein [Xenorhabdus bovienii subsp. africana]
MKIKNIISGMILVVLFLMSRTVFASEEYNITFKNSSSNPMLISYMSESCVPTTDKDKIDIDPNSQSTITIQDKNSLGCFLAEKRITWSVPINDSKVCTLDFIVRLIWEGTGVTWYYEVREDSTCPGMVKDARCGDNIQYNYCKNNPVPTYYTLGKKNIVINL